MASARSAVIQFSDTPDAQSELQFQDLTLAGNNPGGSSSDLGGGYTSFTPSPDQDGETDDLLGIEKKDGSSFWKFSYYQSFFDVDTDQVVQRVLWSMVPLPGRATYLDRQIRPKPDLYGPFWITATLIFSTAISANIANYLMSEGHEHSWSYDFHKVSLAATAIYSYAFLLPIILWGLMWYRQSSNRYTLLEILCVYGYSLAIYVPISILWVIQVAWFQWILVIIGAALSGTVLLQTFWPIFKDENKKIAAVVLCLILLFHTLLAVGFVTYFFQVPSSSKIIVPSSTVPTDLHVSLLHQDVSDSHIKSLSLIQDQNEVKTKESNDSEKANKLLEKEHNVKKKMTSKSSVNEVTSVKLSVMPEDAQKKLNISGHIDASKY